MPAVCKRKGARARMARERLVRMLWMIFRDEYLDRKRARCSSETYISNLDRTLKRFTEYCGLRERTLDEITNRDLETYLRRRRQDRTRKGKPLTNRTINNELSALIELFQYAGPRTAYGSGRRNLGLIAHPPYVELLIEDLNLPVVLLPSQLQAFIAAAQAATTPVIDDCSPGEFWLAALVLGLVGGLRRGAAIKIPRPIDEVLIDQRQLILPAELSKTRCEQRVVLGSADVVAILARMPTKPGEPILPWKDRDGLPMSAGHFSESIRLMQARAGIPDGHRLRLKDTRSTAATVVLDEFGESVAKKKIGHSPHTNTINTNYKARIVSSKDVEASEHLATLVPAIEGFRPKLYGGETA